MDEAPIWLNVIDIERKINQQILRCLPFLILGVVAPVFAWFGFFIPLGDSSDVWFQRSGSITVLFAVGMEYQLMKVSKYIHLSGHAFYAQSELAKRYKSTYSIFQILVSVLAIVGTIIWGYGDLLK